jgi:protein-S-isoprenylcysteine O-methyltransferase Ste14
MYDQALKLLATARDPGSKAVTYTIALFAAWDTSKVERVPRAAGLLIWTLGAVAMYGLVPHELSRLGERVGPPRKKPLGMRSAGLVIVAIGASLMAWAFAAHYKGAPRGWAVHLRPASDSPRENQVRTEHLLQTGPYRLTRNPMYAGEAIVWLGWALFYNRPPVWVGLAILCAAFPKIVRWEEQRLLERFGDAYRAYTASVPRWVGRTDPKWRPPDENPLHALSGWQAEV